MFKDGFANVSGGGRIEMGGVNFVHRVPSIHIYSYSCGDLGELKKAMWVDAPEPYSACLKIEDPVGLLKTIMTQGKVLTTKTAVSTNFAAGWAKVAYEDVTQDIRTGPRH